MTKLLRMARDFVFIKLDYILLRTMNAKLHVRSRECVNYIASRTMDSRNRQTD